MSQASGRQGGGSWTDLLSLPGPREFQGEGSQFGQPRSGLGSFITEAGRPHWHTRSLGVATPESKVEAPDLRARRLSSKISLCPGVEAGPLSPASLLCRGGGGCEPGRGLWVVGTGVEHTSEGKNPRRISTLSGLHGLTEVTSSALLQAFEQKFKV